MIYLNKIEAHRMLLCGVAPLRSTSTQKDTERYRSFLFSFFFRVFCVFG
jgi:hypothetical protein